MDQQCSSSSKNWQLRRQNPSYSLRDAGYYLCGTSKIKSLVSRTTPRVGEPLKNLEYEIKETLTPSILSAANAQLTKAIFNQESFLNIDQDTQENIMKAVKHKKTKLYKEQEANTIKKESSASKSASKRNQVRLLLR